MDDRRTFLVGAALLLLPGRARAKRAEEPRWFDDPRGGGAGKEEEEVTPVEDLMREHGVLRRVLMVYEEVSRRLLAADHVPVELLPAAAKLVRRFVEDYHERLEEDLVFPRFEKAGRLTDLVAVLRTQHQRGRELTDQLVHLGAPGAMKGDADRRRIAEMLRAFIRMYGPHAAYEDTVLFPGFRGLVGGKEYAALGKQFEDKEHTSVKTASPRWWPRSESSRSRSASTAWASSRRGLDPASLHG
jgi:hemerythrin-like domain-containing protein